MISCKILKNLPYKYMHLIYILNIDTNLSNIYMYFIVLINQIITFKNKQNLLKKKSHKCTDKCF